MQEECVLCRQKEGRRGWLTGGGSLRCRGPATKLSRHPRTASPYLFSSTPNQALKPDLFCGENCCDCSTPFRFTLCLNSSSTPVYANANRLSDCPCCIDERMADLPIATTVMYVSYQVIMVTLDLQRLGILAWYHSHTPALFSV